MMELLLDPAVIAALLGGLALGIGIGAIPGVSGTMGLALLLPLTFQFPPQVAIPLLTSLYLGVQFGGAIPAVLLNTPGSGSAAATTFDGYPMAKRGEAGRALGIALMSSACGGLIGVAALVFLAPQLASVALAFGPAQFFALALFGLSMVTSLTAKSLSKGLLAAALGLMVATVGRDPLVAETRYAFGSLYLQDSFHFVPVLLGMFALAEIFRRIGTVETPGITYASSRTKLPSWAEFIALRWHIARSGAIGAFLGALPGAGATVASFISYNEAVRFSKSPEKMGTGQPEGIAASEAADNSAACTAMVPLLSLGIPGSASTAIILGAFHMQGLSLGPRLFADNLDLIHLIFVGLLIVNLAVVIFGLLGARLFSLIVTIPYRVLAPSIVVLATVGAYAVRNNPFDMLVLLIFGIVGFIFDRFDIPKAPFILAMILGPIAEINFRRGLMIHGGDAAAMLTDAIVISLIAVSALSFAFPLMRTAYQKIKS
jgi:putative tricarboxylic transport membrane protein